MIPSFPRRVGGTARPNSSTNSTIRFVKVGRQLSSGRAKTRCHSFDRVCLVVFSPFLPAQSLYYDEFRWSLVKSFSMFTFGILLAKGIKYLDPLGLNPQPPQT